MTIPNTVKIGAITYRLTDNIRDFAQLANHADINVRDIEGLTDTSSTHIAISPDTSPTKQPVIIVHETLHAICEATGLTYKDEFNPLEEEIVRRLAPYILMLIRDNPKLIAHLQQHPATRRNNQ